MVTENTIEAFKIEFHKKENDSLDYDSRLRAAIEAALSAQVQDVAEYEHREQVCKDAALLQWERSLKRLDLDEKDRVTGAIEAYKRQAFAFTMLSAAPAANHGEA